LERTNITRVGSSIGSLYGIITTGVDPQTGYRVFIDGQQREVLYNHAFLPGERYRYRDGSIAPSIDIARDGKILGDAIPKVFGGFANNLSFKNFDFTIDAIYSFAASIYNGSKAGLRDQRFWNNHTDVLTRWQKPGDLTKIPRVVYNDNISNGSAFAISANVESGDFIKIRMIGLGYTIPNEVIERIGLANFRFYAQVQNAFIITNYTGSDPEVSTNGNATLTPGVDRNATGQARTIAVGINVGF
jgi:TonB-dependent starch-binding outer membrane protein SusC